MKTEPTEALKYIEQHMMDGAINYSFDAEKACNIAFQEGQSSPKIKELEWEEDPFVSSDLVSYTPFRSYEIRRGRTLIVSENDWRLLDTLDDTKAAAQRDFENRVKQCLEL